MSCGLGYSKLTKEVESYTDLYFEMLSKANEEFFHLCVYVVYCMPAGGST